MRHGRFPPYLGGKNTNCMQQWYLSEPFNYCTCNDLNFQWPQNTLNATNLHEDIFADLCTVIVNTDVTGECFTKKYVPEKKKEKWFGNDYSRSKSANVF